MEERIKQLEIRLNNLQKAFEQSQRNQVPVTARADSASGAIPRIDEAIKDLTPYTDTKQAYIGDTEAVFTNAPQGNLTVFMDGDYTVDREGGIITVHFEPLEEVTTITISIQEV